MIDPSFLSDRFQFILTINSISRTYVCINYQSASNIFTVTHLYIFNGPKGEEFLFMTGKNISAAYLENAFYRARARNRNRNRKTIE